MSYYGLMKGSRSFMNHQRILFLGFRRGALKAAAKMQLQYDLVEEVSSSFFVPKLGDQYGGLGRVWEINLAEDWVRFYLQNIHQFPPYQAVVALTEKWVAVAGKMRDILKLPGLTEEQASHCHYKNQMKIKAQSAGLNVSPFQVISAQLAPDEIIKKWGWPLVIKESGLSGGRGMHICRNHEELTHFWKVNKIVEAFIAGTELSVESFVCEGKTLLVNMTSYHRVLEMNVLPARLSDDLELQLKTINSRVIEIFNIQNGVTHLELYITQNGIYFGELAVRPPGGHIFKLLEWVYSFDPWEFFLRLELKDTLNVGLLKAQGFAGAWVIHPGSGYLNKSIGRSEVENIPELKKLRLKIKPPLEITPRVGSGMEIGHALFWGDTYQQVVNAMEKAKDQLKFIF